jgi:hypothetical protein
MDFPTLVYRCPGPHWGPPGTTYQAEPVVDASDLAAALSAGWFATLPEAVEAFLTPPSEPASETADEAPLTRESLEAKALELGVKLDKRWGDKRLMEEIAKALESGA